MKESDLEMEKEIDTSHAEKEKEIYESDTEIEKEIDKFNAEMDKEIKEPDVEMENKFVKTDEEMEKETDISNAKMEKEIEESDAVIEKEIDDSNAEEIEDFKAEIEKEIVKSNAELEEIEEWNAKMEEEKEESSAKMEKEIDESDTEMEKEMDKFNGETENIMKESDLEKEKEIDKSHAIVEKFIHVDNCGTEMEKEINNSDVEMEKEIEGSDAEMEKGIDKSNAKMEKTIDKFIAKIEKEMEESDAEMEKEIVKFDAEVKKDIVKTHAKIEESYAEMETEINISHAEMEKEIEECRAKTDKEIEESEVDMEEEIEEFVAENEKEIDKTDEEMVKDIEESNAKRNTEEMDFDFKDTDIGEILSNDACTEHDTLVDTSYDCETHANTAESGDLKSDIPNTEIREKDSDPADVHIDDHDADRKIEEIVSNGSESGDESDIANEVIREIDSDNTVTDDEGISSEEADTEDGETDDNSETEGETDWDEISETEAEDKSNEMHLNNDDTITEEEFDGVHRKAGVDSIIGHLKLLYTNSDCLLNKLDELSLLLEQCTADIIVICECLPKNYDIKPTMQNYQLEDYVQFSNIDKEDVRGVLLYVHKRYASLVKEISYESNFDDCVWVNMRLKGMDSLILGGIYRSPTSNRDSSSTDKVTELLYKVADSNPSHLIIVGDFNYPNINWENWTSHHSHEQKFIDCLSDCFLHQHIDEYTRYRTGQQPHILDLLITNEEGMIGNVSYLPGLGLSDHQCILIDVNLYAEQTLRKEERYRYHKGDYQAINDTIVDKDWYSELESMNADESWNFFSITYQAAIDRHIPKTTGG
nr:titin homolog [Lytechinus pictus]